MGRAGTSPADPELQVNLAEERPDVCALMQERVLRDAGGEIPELLRGFEEKLGCTPYVQDVSG
ncbi:MAG: hypothetical protein HPY83_11155 [Anaerolineae bacterium]|nr:hypothetical protein [Anaerolineae bacterium]